MGRYKNRAHKISSWKYQAIWSPVLPVPSPTAPRTECLTFALHPGLLPPECWRSAAATAWESILVVINGKWHHLLNGHESEQTPGDSEGQGSLMFMGSQSQTQLSDCRTMWQVLACSWPLPDQGSHQRPVLEAQSLNHWTAKEGPYFIFICINIYPYTFYVEWRKKCTFNTGISHRLLLLVNIETIQVCLIHLCIACAWHRWLGI